MKISSVNFNYPTINSRLKIIKSAGCDSVSFGHNYYKGEIKKSDEEFLNKLIERCVGEAFKQMDEKSRILLTQSLCGNEIRILHDKSDYAQFNKFTVDKGYHTMFLGVMHYDDKNELQYITIEKCPEGHRYMHGEMRVFDKEGKEVKHLSAQQVKALLWYRGNVSYGINNVLRYYSEDNPFMRDDIAVMDSLFKDPKIYSFTEKPMYVYRGIKINPENIENMFSKGNIYQDKAFLSTSDRPECAVPNERNILLKIEVPKGKKFIDMHLLTSVSDFYLNEHEMLFDRNQKMIVKNYDPKTQTVTMSFI